jgi:hypothetical protein
VRVAVPLADPDSSPGAVVRSRLIGFVAGSLALHAAVLAGIDAGAPAPAPRAQPDRALSVVLPGPPHSRVAGVPPVAVAAAMPPAAAHPDRPARLAGGSRSLSPGRWPSVAPVTDPPTRPAQRPPVPGTIAPPAALPPPSEPDTTASPAPPPLAGTETAALVPVEPTPGGATPDADAAAERPGGAQTPPGESVPTPETTAADMPDTGPLQSKVLARHPSLAAVEALPMAEATPAPSSAAPSPGMPSTGALAPERGLPRAGEVPSGGVPIGRAGDGVRGHPWWHGTDPSHPANAAGDDAFAWEAEARRRRERTDRIASLEAEIRRAADAIPRPAGGFAGECMAVPVTDGAPVLHCDPREGTARDASPYGPLAAALAQLSGLAGRLAILRIEAAADRFDLSLRYGDNPAITRR